MSRFANVTATRVIKAACRCDGKPHPQDEVTIRTELPYGAAGVIGVAGWSTSDKAYNSHAARLKLVELVTVSWNILGPAGKPWDPSAISIAMLDADTVDWIAKEANADFERKGKATLPNASAGTSASGSSDPASPTPETPAQTSSTTSS
jgi:hypothetical protein